MKLNRAQNATNRRRVSILREEFESDRDEQISEEMQRAIEETRERIAAAFAGSMKVQAKLRHSASAR